jgi:crotonobetainyl-CoA:carnitine CoA-transferase CaiB-like acyl-CoA transferase
MSGGLLALMAPHLAAAAAGTDVRPGVAPLLGGVACYAVHPCRDGFLAVAALESQFWQALCRSLGRPDLIANQWAAPGTPGWLAVAQALSGLSRAEAAALDRAAPCCLTPVSGIDEVLARGQADGTISAVPVARQRGETSLADCSVAVVPSAVVIDRVPPHMPEPPPLLGADTQEVLLAAGFAPVEVDGLMRTGAVAGRAAGPTGTFLGGGNPA